MIWDSGWGLVSAILAFVGLCIAGISLWINLRNRRDARRQADQSERFDFGLTFEPEESDSEPWTADAAGPALLWQYQLVKNRRTKGLTEATLPEV